MTRWYCHRCGIVRDVSGDSPPFCRHNDTMQTATRMQPISESHPYATGPLPWGTDDPSTSRAT